MDCINACNALLPLVTSRKTISAYTVAAKISNKRNGGRRKRMRRSTDNEREKEVEMNETVGKKAAATSNPHYSHLHKKKPTLSHTHSVRNGRIFRECVSNLMFERTNEQQKNEK